MSMLREKTEDVNEYHEEQAKVCGPRCGVRESMLGPVSYFSLISCCRHEQRPQPKPTRVEQPRERSSSVSELLEMSKPKLNVKPKVRVGMMQCVCFAPQRTLTDLVLFCWFSSGPHVHADGRKSLSLMAVSAKK